ncbi:MAG: BTAD domain-containing putative transcriptional regulator [Actinophytocola sp.]|uniref:AfsR/SARP family transcriptional regulator n=1 Tax=Actinophytocola sp. TaxID=1872138 RepID=UPI003C74A300
MLRLMGPLTLSNHGREIDLGGPRQRVVLAMLALNANRVVPVEQLIDAVWNTAPPTTARAQVQICVSTLRKIFLDSNDAMRIRTRSPGYQLDVPPDELDTEQFTSLVTTARAHSGAGRCSEAVATLRTALDLWRGNALADLHSDLIRRGADQLEHARLTAVMERLQLDLTLGRHEEVVGELTTLVEEHPLRERLYEFLMLALYRSGRQAEALEVCRRARTVLVEELGIEPGKGLQELETSILNRMPELDLPDTGPRALPRDAGAPAREERPRAMPRRLPASIADFTGRDEQLAEIRQALSGDEQDSRLGIRIVAISGKGGVGKSTLAIRAAHELREVYPDGHLFADLEAPSGTGRVQDVLDRFLRALGVDGNSIPADAEEKADMYRSRLANLRVLIVLDGASSEEEVIPLLPAGSGCAVIVTSRSPLSGLPGAHLIAIHPMDVALSLEMLTKIIGPERMAAETDAAIELVDFCGRLPLAMRIAGARLASRPHWRLDVLVARLRNTARRLDELTYRGLELRSSIGLTYRVLENDAKQLFRLFSVVPTADFAGWTAAALLDCDPFDAEEVLEHLVETQLLDTVAYPGEHPRYRFHDLIRVYAQERLKEEEPAEDRDAAMVRLIGALLAKAEDAHGKEYGGDYTILHGSGPRWRPAGGGDHDIDDPMEWLRSERRSLVAAVRLAAEMGEDELCWDLALTAVTLFEVKGYYDDWRETSEVALEATTRAGNRRGRAAMLYSLGSMSMSQRRLEAAEERFAAALEIFRADGEMHGCALVLRNSAMVDRLRGRSTAMLTKYHEALRLMREVGDPVGEAGILRSLAKLRIDEGNTDHARELLEKALECTRRVNYLRGEAQVVIRFAELYLGENQVNEAHRALNRVLLIVRNIGDRIGEAHALYGVGVVRLRTGRLDNAKSTLQHAHSLAGRVGERLIEAQSLYALGEIALARGNGETGLEHLTEACRLFAELGSTVWHAKALILMSDVHQGAGELDLAWQELEQADALLTRTDSKEAERLSSELDAVKATLFPHVVNSIG